MSKSIYKEVIKELTWLVHDEFYETTKSSILNASQRLEMFIKVRDTLEQARKQEKLLELYKRLDDLIVAPNGHHVCRYTDDEKYARIRKQIKELEND